jgi:hypothetical protein
LAVVAAVVAMDHTQTVVAVEAVSLWVGLPPPQLALSVQVVPEALHLPTRVQTGVFLPTRLLLLAAVVVVVLVQTALLLMPEALEP